MRSGPKRNRINAGVLDALQWFIRDVDAEDVYRMLSSNDFHAQFSSSPYMFPMVKQCETADVKMLDYTLQVGTCVIFQ